MPKFMHMRNMYFSKLDLQLFAGDDDAGDDSGDGDDQDDDSEDDDTDEDGEDEPKYTQADLDKAVARTIAKERAKAERAAKRKEQKNKDKGSDGADENEDVKARKEAEAKASSLEVKCACFEAGVSKDAVDDVTALARAYMAADEDLDLEDAIEKVVKKYPQFKKGSADPYEDEDETKGKSWGQRQNGRAPKKMSGVEKRFYELNPDLK